MILYHGTNTDNTKLSLQFRLFNKGIISPDVFVDGLTFKQLYTQFPFHTERAIACLAYEGYEISWHPKSSN